MSKPVSYAALTFGAAVPVSTVVLERFRVSKQVLCAGLRFGVTAQISIAAGERFRVSKPF